MARRRFGVLLVSAVIPVLGLGVQPATAAVLEPALPIDIAVAGVPPQTVTGTCVANPDPRNASGQSITLIVRGSAQAEGLAVYTQIDCKIYQDLDRDGKWNDKGGCFRRFFASFSICENLGLRVGVAPWRPCAVVEAGYPNDPEPVTGKGGNCPKKVE